MCLTLCECVSLIPKWPGNETSGCVIDETLRAHVCDTENTMVYAMNVAVILIPKWPGNETSGCVRH